MGVAACGDIGDIEAGWSLRACGGYAVLAGVAAGEAGDCADRAMCAGRLRAGNGVVAVRGVGHGIGGGGC